MKLREWLDPVYMPLWWYFASAFLAAFIVVAVEFIACKWYLLP